MTSAEQRETAISSLARELKELTFQLREKKVKPRKDALERLNAIFASEQNLSSLDAFTFGVAPREHDSLGYACEYVSWASILTCLMDGVWDDIAKSLNKGVPPESLYSRTVRSVVYRAMNRRDTAYYNVLEPVSIQLIFHLSQVMERTYAFRQESQVYNDYSTTLKFLLDHAGFRGCYMSAEDFSRTMKPLCKMILQNVDSSRDDNAKASFMVKDLAVLRSVLGRMTHDMDQHIRADLLQILEDFGKYKSLQGWTSRICNEVVGLCVQTMLYCSGDAGHVLRSIVENLHHPAMLLLREGNLEGRESALLFYRVALKLELISKAHVQELFEWYQGLDLDGAWQKSPECAEYMLNQGQSLLMLLIVDIEIFMYQNLGHFGRDVSSAGTYASGKRKRQNRQLGLDLVLDAVRQPAALGPIACAFLINHGEYLSRGDLDSACSCIADSIRAALQHSFVSEQVKPEIVWTMRMLFAATLAFSERDDCSSSSIKQLGEAVSLLAQQYKILSSYSITRDLVKMILAVALPGLHDSLFLGDAESLRRELLSETPSATSIVLVTLLLRYKKLPSLPGVLDLYVDWMLRSVTAGDGSTAFVSSNMACTALCTLLFGGNTVKYSEIEEHLAATKQQWVWWRESDTDAAVNELPPVSTWSTHGYLDKKKQKCGGAHQESSHAVLPAVHAIKHLWRTLEQICASSVQDDLFNATALGLDILSRLEETDNHTHPMSKFASQCITRVSSWVGNCAALPKATAASVVRFAHALSQQGDRTNTAVKDMILSFPKFKESFDYAMQVSWCGDSDVVSSQPVESRTGPITGGASRGSIDASRPVPMVHWYLDVILEIASFSPSETLDELGCCFRYLSVNKYSLPIELRLQLAALETSCIEALLSQGEIPGHLDNIWFLDRTRGMFSYDQVFLFSSGLFVDLLQKGFRMVREASALEQEDAAKVCMSCVSDQLFQLMEETIDMKTSCVDRIGISNMIISLLETDSSLVSESQFETLVEWLATLVVDRYSVRLAMATTLPRLLDFFSDPTMLFHKVLEMLPLQFNDDRDKIIPIDCDLDELLRTVILTLGTVGSQIADLELTCVSCLIQELQAEDQSTLNDAVIDALTRLANALGYESVQDYMVVMSRPIIVAMLQNPGRAFLCMEKYLLACRLLNTDGVPGQRVLFAFLVYHRSVHGVKALLSYLHVKHFPFMLRKSMGEVCTAHFFASSMDNLDGLLMDVTNNLTTMASLLRADLDIESLLGDLSDEVIINIVGHRWGCCQNDEQSHVFSNDVRAVTKFAERLAGDVYMGSLPRPVDRLKLLICVQQKISDFKNPRHKVQAVKAAACAVLYVKDQWATPGILRQLLGIVSILVKSETTCAPACEILQHLIDHVLQNLTHESEFEELVRTIVSNLPLILSHVCDTLDESSLEQGLVDSYIRHMLLNESESYAILHKRIIILDPRIQRFFGYDHSIKSDVSVKECLAALGEIVGMLSPSTRRECIRLIRQKMKQPIQMLESDLIGEQSLWRIVHEASINQNDRLLVEFASQLVSYFGPLKPHVLSFNPMQYDAVSRAQIIIPHPMQSISVEVFEVETYRSSLFLLHSYLIQDDSCVAAEAFAILQELLSTTPGASSFNSLDRTTQSHLEIFRDSKMGYLADEDEHQTSLMLDPETWRLAGKKYDDWISGIGYDVLSKSKNTVLASCANMARLRANFAELVLPLAFVYVSLDQDTAAEVADNLGTLITEHVLPHFGTYPKASHVLLRILHTLRLLFDVEMEAADSRQIKQPLCQSWKSMYWISLDYLDLTEACISSRALYSGLIFAELWRESKIKEASAAEFQRFERLMQELFSLLPEPDGLYAMSRSNDAMSQIRRFEREGDWSRAMVMCDLALQLQREDPGAGVMNIPHGDALGCIRRCLANLGSSYLLSSIANMTQSTEGHGEALVTPAVAALGEWHPIQMSNISGSESADRQLSQAVKHFGIGYFDGFVDSIHSLRSEVISLLASASRETTADLNPLIVKVQMAESIAESWDLKWNCSGLDVDDPDIESLVERWKQREAQAGAGWRFSLDMPMKDLRNELLKALGRQDLGADCLLDIAICARKAERNGLALGALSRFRKAISQTKEPWCKAYRLPESNWRIEEAKNLWAQNQKDAAIMTLLSNSTAAKVNDSNVIEIAYLNTVLAKWLAATQRESSSSILDTLIQATDALSEARESLDEASTGKYCRISYRMASYADQLRTEIAQRKLSVEWVKAKSILKTNKKQMEGMQEKLKSGYKSHTGERQMLHHSVNKLNKAIKEDEAAIDSAEMNELEYDILAIRGYCMALKNGGRYDMPSSFRLIDRWLSPRSPDHDEQINLVLMDEVKDVPSHKLIPLAYQLASRLDETKQKKGLSLFQNNLKALLLKMSKEHPFHMLPILFALKNGGKTKNTARGGFVFAANHARIEAASSIIDTVGSSNDRLCEIVDEMDCATQGYIEIAMSEVDPSAKSGVFPSKWRRKFCKELTHIPLLSVHLPYDLSLQYSDLPTIASIDEKITFPGGINKPKLVTLVDSLGRKHKQLVKGKDDLRQDAVMQQFFRICNAFFQDAKPTATRNLSIRTYFALPFSPSSGLLEWIDNTESLDEFIADGNRRYMSARRAVMVKLHDLQTKREGWNENVSLREKRKVFEACVKELGAPRMSRVFLRRFQDPGKWFEARLAYTRSVAVNSMAGHIIGLGDRHLSNILVSKSSAELIHIDLGIAFEQGKLLRTPEQVPFRLTRNMVDAMGASGVEGVMRRCCEEVLRVMRKHKEPIVTVLSVFIHDPLYSWALSHRAKPSQEEEPHTSTETKAEGNVAANRTLLVIKHKLEGIIGGDTTARGIEGQVQYLLQESMLSDNLCRMWRGWQAHI
jgi:hypothetical protein